MSATKPYAEVRALSRGIALLVELNRVGHARASSLASAASIDRTTTYRLLATLERLGLVAHRPSDNEFVLAANVRTLSEGFVHRDLLTRIAGQHLGILFQKVLWPTDFAVFEHGAMVIRDTTHRFSPYSVHRAVIGHRRPMFASALGRAFLAGASPAQRQSIVEIARGGGGKTLGLASPAMLDNATKQLMTDFEMHGYSWSVGETEPHISALALPIRGPAGARGAINLVFFRSAMTVVQAAERFVDAMRACVAGIEAEMAREESLDQVSVQPHRQGLEPE